MNHNERLQAIKRELEKQNEVWSSARQKLQGLEHTELAVPSGVLEALDTCTRTSPIQPAGAVRA